MVNNAKVNVILVKEDRVTAMHAENLNDGLTLFKNVVISAKWKQC